ncbi:RNA polymerase RpoN-/SigL-like sigma 54 subunit [Edaphobacter aggregans]|uniref:RNA polymerase RpoN-/SigL-like sigma 54 subunit n=1 Tax=Edaphobacter aggregans TaxID=570835 RepID=A0A3R9P8H0_9BACT|nr:RNA polymerase factor sigma-54 [Edaphobacter aggregans]RSL15847.1 RNA polymerase RpoN-/SigL-like sigma 54 subunit [Edaphobacter aggregans]
MLLQPKLNVKVSQRQVLTPGLVQMVSVLALNKLELKEMINTEMVENPVLEELEESGVPLEERAGIEGDRERSAEEVVAETERVEKDPFDEIDFGSYFQDYLDPGFKTASNFEEYDKPSFENFLSQPSTLSDHLMWQLGSLTLSPEVQEAAELVVGNLNENGYLTASDEELVESLMQFRVPVRSVPIPFERGTKGKLGYRFDPEAEQAGSAEEEAVEIAAAADQERERLLAVVAEARGIVNHLDPVGVAARDLRECLLIQIKAQQAEAAIVLRRRQKAAGSNGAAHAMGGGANVDVFATATHIVENCLPLLQKKDMRELTRSCGRTSDEVQAAVEFIRTLDPRPGQRYNQSETRLIEPDVAFVKRDDKYVVVMNEEDMPTLRLNQGYRKMLQQKQTEKEVKEYVKERYKSAIQLLRNIEQRKNTIVRTCEVIVRRQTEFLEHGVEALKPMMIKEVAEEIGVHPSTVSRAVANKYVHTSQGVFELRFFFSEGVNGPEGGDLPLVLLKRKVKKLIEEEDERKPLTDDQLAAELQRQGIQVTRRTVAKYREDMQIPSTHQRRVR